MATILRAPERLTASQKKATTTLFLAGPFEVVRLTRLRVEAAMAARAGA